MVKADLGEKRSIFVLCERGTHTAWGFLYKKRHVDKFHNKMSFSKNSRFNFFLYSCYMISVVYDS